MNMKFLSGLVFSVMILVTAECSHAIPDLTPSSGSYMTDSDKTTPTTNKPSFSWDEKPFNFVQFNKADLGKTLTLHWTWKYGDELIFDGGDSIFAKDIKTSLYDRFQYLNNWDTVKEGRAGDWSVLTTWQTGGRNSGSQTLNFTLNAVPEPISSALFLIGGSALAAWQIRKKKKSV